VCKSAIALYLNVIRRTCNKLIMNPVIRTRTRHFRRLYRPTRDNISKGSRNETRGQTDKQTQTAVYVFISCASCKEHEILGTCN
jgi:hypothetical protein